MKTLYLDCGMGAAGDMLSAALIGLFDDPQGMTDRLNAIGIPHVTFALEPAVRCGITGTRMRVYVHGEEEHAHDHDHGHDHDYEYEHDHAHGHDHHHHDHAHAAPDDIAHLIGAHLSLPDSVREDALRVFRLLADAESHVHGVPVEEIHFHEVGTLDAVADIVSVCYLLHALAVDEVIASPVRTGFGHVRCAHGVLPVPAPATAYLLRGVPICTGDIESELCTPTGAALLKALVTRFGEMPTLRIQAIGYGMGEKEFPTANCVRAMLGETSDETDRVVELSCDLDDMTGEEIGYAVGRLFAAGALDVYTMPVFMKKNRPGTLLQALCKPSDKERVVQAMFRCTTTLGVRACEMTRCTLQRKRETVETAYGTVRRKTSVGYGVTRVKIEADDVSRVADEQACGFREAARLLEQAQGET